MAKGSATAFVDLSEDEVIALIEDGHSLTLIASDQGKVKSELSKWLNADPKRSARAKEARVQASAAWDEQAEQGIKDAPDVFGLAKAKELAHHYRWRASKIAPKIYGDKLELEHRGQVDLVSTLNEARRRVE